MRNDYIYDDGGRHHYFRMKYKKDFVGDCAIRAVAIATGTDYQETRKQLWEISLENGKLPNDDETTQEFIKRKNFVKKVISKGILLGDFPFNERKTFVVLVKVGYQRHLVAVDQGLVRDTWDCRDRFVMTVWMKP